MRRVSDKHGHWADASFELHFRNGKLSPRGRGQRNGGFAAGAGVIAAASGFASGSANAAVESAKRSRCETFISDDEVVS